MKITMQELAWIIAGLEVKEGVKQIHNDEETTFSKARRRHLRSLIKRLQGLEPGFEVEITGE